MSKKNKSILIISDTHFPYHHPDTFDFLLAIKTKYKPNTVVHIGDELDYHALSFHPSDPNLMSAGCELDKGLESIQKLQSIFPKLELLESNHGSMVYRKALHHGIPKQVLKSYRQILNVGNGWTWHMDLTLKTSVGSDVFFHHSLGSNALRFSQQLGMNCVFGHHHNKFSIQHWTAGKERKWGMFVGCLIDLDSMAFAYGKNNLAKPIIGCGLIIDGEPKLAPMVQNESGRWIEKLT